MNEPSQSNSIVSSIRNLVTALLTTVFGRFSWQPPTWLPKIWQPLKQRLITIGSGFKARPVRSSGITLVTLGALGIAVGGIVWYANLPEPQKISVQITVPQPTKLEKPITYDPLRLIFSSSAAPLEQIGKRVKKGIELFPDLNGVWVWQDDRRLNFLPKEDWHIGQEYTVRIQDNFLPSQCVLERYDLKFTTKDFFVSIDEMQFYQDPTDQKIKKVVATVSFSHPVDTFAFEKRIFLGLSEGQGFPSGKPEVKLKYEVTYDEFKGQAYIHSHPIPVPLEDRYAVLILDEGIRAERGGSATTNEIRKHVVVPGMYNYFKVSYIDTTIVQDKNYKPKQVLAVSCNLRVKQDELNKHLSVYVLPKDRPKTEFYGYRRNHRWNDEGEVTDDILRNAPKVSLEPIPSEEKYSETHSYTFKVPEDRYLAVIVKKGLLSYGEYMLALDEMRLVAAPNYPRQIKIMQEGALLSLTGEKKISIVTLGVENIRVEIGRILPDKICHLVSQTSGSFNDPYFNNYYFNKDDIVKRQYEVQTLNYRDPSEPVYTSFDFTPYLQDPDSNQRRGMFFIRVTNWDPKHKRTRSPSDDRMILVTDLGLLVKESETTNQKDVFVMSISSGTPVSGATVFVIGRNGLPIIQANTDAQGHVVFPDLKDFEREQKPTAYIAALGEDMVFLPYERRDRNLRLSRFDTGGLHTNDVDEDQLKAYLFSDRQLYRPGEEFNVGIIVRRQDLDLSVSGIPIEVIITDPRYVELERRRMWLSKEGFEEISYQTMTTSPTGYYRIEAFIVKDDRRRSRLGITSVRVEEFLPDRLKITAGFSTERHDGWVSPKGLKGNAKLMNLYGTPAEDNRIECELTVYPAIPRFSAYEEYTFYDPIENETTYSDRLGAKQTDENGEVSFDLGLDKFDPGAYRVILDFKAFEKSGGRSVRASASALVSPRDFLVGYKTDGDMEYVYRNSQRSVNLIAVNAKMVKVAAGGMKLRLVEERYVSTLTRRPNGTYQYVSTLKEIVVDEKPFSIPANGLNYALPTAEAGDYALVVLDKDDAVLNRIRFSVIGEANLSRSLDRNAELKIKLNKSSFKPSEQIEVFIKAPYTGAGLITIEREEVLAYQWFKTNSPSAVQYITVPSDLEGNGYVNVSFVRAVDSREIYMSPLSYGVAPFFINREKRDYPLEVTCPELTKPGRAFPIRVKTKQPGKVVVFAVDEGILQVARYTNPKPLDYFMRKRALQVETAQILDQILPEFANLRHSATGGDAGGAALAKNLNPFQRKTLDPVAYWSGIVDMGAEERDFIYEIPDYFNGTLRVLVVGISPDTMGTDVQKSTVRGDFVISPTVPTFIAPGDVFDVKVNIANNLEGSGPNAVVSLKLETSEHLSISGEPVLTLPIPEGKEITATYRLTANDILGSANCAFKTWIGDSQAKYAIDTSVRPAIPYRTQLTSGYLRSGSGEVEIERNMYPHHRQLKTTASALPVSLTHGLLTYLREYPWGCTEQLISQSFPLVVAHKYPEFGMDKETANKALKQTMYMLQSRQHYSGSFGYWSASSPVHDWLAVYTMHFLTEAKEYGYPVPSKMHQKGLRYLQNMSRKAYNSLPSARNTAYALYVLTRNGQQTTNQVSALKNYLEKNFERDVYQNDLASLYLAACLRMLQFKPESEQMFYQASFIYAPDKDYENFYDALIHSSQYLFLSAKHFPDRIKRITGEDLIKYVNPILEGYYNTVSSCFTILGLAAYLDAIDPATVGSIDITEQMKDGSRNKIDLPEGLFPSAPFSPQAVKLNFSGPARPALFYQITEAGFDRQLPETVIKNKLEVQREYRNKDGKTVTSATLGEELTVVLRIRSIDRDTIPNVAVIDLLPGGFQPVLDSLQTARGGSRYRHNTNLNQTGLREWTPNYVDVREDRVVMFGYSVPDVNEFTYRIQATNTGRFTLPPIMAESMYDRTVQARALGGEMVVTEAE